MLRSADAVDYLRLKSTFQESDSNAIYADGRVLPVLIRTVKGAQQCAVEIDDQLFEAAKVTGFQGFQKIPEPVAPAPPPREPTTDEIFAERYKAALEANPGADAFILRKKVAEQMYAEARNQQYSQRVAQQVQSFGQFSPEVTALSQMNKRARQEFLASRR